MEANNRSLEYFKDWSNYLLVTTVAALGWVATDSVTFWSGWIRVACIWSFAVSIVFAILTLAMIPLIAQQQGNDQDIYAVEVKCWICMGKMKLRRVCLPQHFFFMLGIILYATGTSDLSY